MGKKRSWSANRNVQRIAYYDGSSLVTVSLAGDNMIDILLTKQMINRLKTGVLVWLSR